MLLNEESWNADVDHVALACPLYGTRYRETDLGAHEGGGGLGVNGLPKRLACISIKSRRQIHCQHRCWMTVHASDELKGCALQWPIQPRSEKGIDQQVRVR